MCKLVVVAVVAFALVVQLVRSFSKKGITVMRNIIAATIASASALIATGAGATNLVQNGDFDNIGEVWTDNTGLGSKGAFWLPSVESWAEPSSRALALACDRCCHLARSPRSR